MVLSRGNPSNLGFYEWQLNERRRSIQGSYNIHCVHYYVHIINSHEIVSVKFDQEDMYMYMYIY